MAFLISSKVYPRAIFAATFAMGYPVALDASAEERDTRGFTSITPVSYTHLQMQKQLCGQAMMFVTD